jgi:hypothetical protein
MKPRKSYLDRKHDGYFAYYVPSKGRLKRASLREWLAFRASPDALVATSDIGNVTITTFLGTGKLTMSYETIVFGGHPPIRKIWAETRKAAEQNHEKACAAARK